MIQVAFQVLEEIIVDITSVGRAFGLGHFRHFASVLNPRHIEMRPKGGTFDLGCKGPEP